AAGALIRVRAVARQWRNAACALAAALGTAIDSGVRESFYARARTEVLLEALTTYSMPGGHSAAAFALCVSLAVLAGRCQPVRLRLTWMLVAGIPALAIALSRVYLGVHWPTVILAGLRLAFCVCAASLAFIPRKAPLPALSVRVWWLVLPAMRA
ncbi:phosphatase PAP2 family protein, partial [Pseudomonas syringae]